MGKCVKHIQDGSYNISLVSGVTLIAVSKATSNLSLKIVDRMNKSLFLNKCILSNHLLPSDSERTCLAIIQAEGKRLTYSQPIKVEKSEAGFDRYKKTFIAPIRMPG